MYQVIFQFENSEQEVKAFAAPDATLLDVARSSNVAIDAPCSGNGSCGKCKVKLLDGELDSPKTAHISHEEYAAGWRLSCASKVISDVTILVPDIASAYQSRMKTADLSSKEEIAVFEKLQADVSAAGIAFVDDFVEVVVQLDEPTLDDTMPDTERVIRGVQAELGCGEVRLPYFVVRKLARLLRISNFRIKVVGERRGDFLQVIDAAPGDDTVPLYACAIDIGTTTVAGVLVDLKTGEILAKASSGNGQIRYGADVINRIIEQGKPGGVKRLQDAIISETLTPLMEAMCHSAKVPPKRILRVAIASNTTAAGSAPS